MRRLPKRTHGTIIVISIGISFTASFFAFLTEVSHKEQRFEDLAESARSLIDFRVDEVSRALEEMRRYVSASSDVTATEFDALAGSILRSNPIFSEIGWVRNGESHPWILRSGRQGEALDDLSALHEKDRSTAHPVSDREVVFFLPAAEARFLRGGRPAGGAFFFVKADLGAATPTRHTARLLTSTLALGDAPPPKAGMPFQLAFTTQYGDSDLVWIHTATDEFHARVTSSLPYVRGGIMFLLGLVLLYVPAIVQKIAEVTQALRQARQASKLKSDFLATMSHEIRTPMNGVLGMAELILSAEPNEKVAEHARTIIRSGETLHHIINDILDFSKIEAGKLEIDPHPLDLEELLGDVARLYSTGARDKAIELIAGFPPHAPRGVIGDAIRLRQVISNFVSNAIKFTEKGYVSVNMTTERTGDNGKTIRLRTEVTDTGPGLTVEAQSRIFHSFTQADSSTTRRYGGTGLGLAICQQLVHLMGGKIGVRSEVGVGSTFWFEVDLPEAPGGSIGVRQTVDALRTKRILLIDDVEAMRALASEQLSAAGADVFPVSSGQQGIEAIMQAAVDGTPFDLVLIDYLMPRMNGEEVARRIGALGLRQPPALALLTAAGNPMADDRFKECGFAGFIEKPFRASVLVDAVVRILNREAGADVIRAIDVTAEGGAAHAEWLSLPDARVLVAEDNIINQAFISEILKEVGCRTQIVPNGHEAVRRMREEGADLIFMDCLMPVMDGFEATAAIRALPRSKVTDPRIPVIALTANAMKGDRERCLAAGMDRYLTKPVRKAEIHAVLREFLAHYIVDEPVEIDTPEIKSPKGQSLDQPPPGEADLIDLAAVAAAASILKEGYAAMIDTFAMSAEERLAELGAARKTQSLHDLIRPAHSLKSSARQMGAARLSELARGLEAEAKRLGEASQAEDLQWEEIDSVIAGMRALIDPTREALVQAAQRAA